MDKSARSPLGDAGRAKRWLTTGETGHVAGAALDYERAATSTLYDYATGERQPLGMSVRQLYLRYLTRAGRLSAGVIPPDEGVTSNTSMDGDSWVKGAHAVTERHGHPRYARSLLYAADRRPKLRATKLRATCLKSKRREERAS